MPGSRPGGRLVGADHPRPRRRGSSRARSCPSGFSTSRAGLGPASGRRVILISRSWAGVSRWISCHSAIDGPAQAAVCRRPGWGQQERWPVKIEPPGNWHVQGCRRWHPRACRVHLVRARRPWVVDCLLAPANRRGTIPRRRRRSPPCRRPRPAKGLDPRGGRAHVPGGTKIGYDPSIPAASTVSAWIGHGLGPGRPGGANRPKLVDVVSDTAGAMTAAQ